MTKNVKNKTKNGKNKTKNGKNKTKKVIYWRDIKPNPKTLKKYLRKYGKKCFLLPNELKYPICDKNNGKVHCKGLLAGHYRAALSTYRKLKPKTYSYRKIMNKSRKIGKKMKCNWVNK